MMGKEYCKESRYASEGYQMDDRKYIPSEDMGDYEEYKKKGRNKKKGPLYPLDEEGSYGAPPSALPPPLPGYQKRERKPKVYASYAVSSDCCMHADKLEQNEKVRGKTPPRIQSKRSTTPSNNRGSSQPRAKSSTVRLPSPAPSPDAYNAKTNWKNSLRSSESPSRNYRGTSAPRTVARKPSQTSPTRREEPKHEEQRVEEVQGRRSMSSDGMSTRSSQSSTDWGYTSYESFTAGKSSRSTESRNMREENRHRSYSSMMDTSYEESDESFYNSAYKTSTEGVLSLDAFKAPELSSWDNLGILGLSSKMYSDTSSMKERVYSSSSTFRRESVTTHAM